MSDGMRDWLLGRLVILSIQRSERGRSQTEFRKYIHIQKIYLRKSAARVAPWNPETQLESARSRERQAVLPTENLIGNFFLCKAPHNLASAFPKLGHRPIGPLSLLKAERFSNVKKNNAERKRSTIIHIGAKIFQNTSISLFSFLSNFLCPQLARIELQLHKNRKTSFSQLRNSFYSFCRFWYSNCLP